MAARDKLIQKRNQTHQLLVSNQVPGAIEANEIQAIMSGKISELDRLRRKIADVQVELRVLLESENPADEEVERC